MYNTLKIHIAKNNSHSPTNKGDATKRIGEERAKRKNGEEQI